MNPVSAAEAGRYPENTGASAPVVLLLHHLAAHGQAMLATEFNRIACQVMELYFALGQGEPRPVDDDPAAWFYHPGRQEIIFPWLRRPAAGSTRRAARVYRRWTEQLIELGLSYRKPPRQRYPDEQQQEVLRRIEDHLRAWLVPMPAIRRIHLMGPAMRGDMGLHLQPHVLNGQVKLGCDVDLLIEIEPGCEDQLPADWHLYLERAGNSSCPVYQLGEIPLCGDDDSFRSEYPAIPFIAHQLQAHVFLPATCDAACKEDFLAEFGATLFHQREAVPGDDDAERARIAGLLSESWGLAAPTVRPLDEPARGRVHRVEVGERQLVLKWSVDSGTFDSRQLTAHARYEAALITALRDRGLSTPAVVPARQGLTARIDGYEALLFESFVGEVCETLEYPTVEAARALARLHLLQQTAPLDLACEFSYHRSGAIWLPWFERSRACPELLPELAEACKAMAPFAERFGAGRERERLLATSPQLHCHGDVKPRNLVQHPDGRLSLFDFDNAVFGPRMADAVDGALAFALAEQHIDHIDFTRFDVFLQAWCQAVSADASEHAALQDWIGWCGLLLFIRELTMWVQGREEMRRRRALAVACFVSGVGEVPAAQAVPPGKRRSPARTSGPDPRSCRQPGWSSASAK